MTSFLTTFGSSAVSPSEVAFAEYTFSSDLTLYWPQFSAGQTDIAARFMNLTATANSLKVIMPDATLVSVGYDVVIFNPGSDTFDVVDFNGGEIANIPSSKTYYLILTDNSTQAGTWQTVQFGVGTGSASAAALAGFGLIALAGVLNVNFTPVLQSIDYSITSGNRASLQVWNGGGGTITLPDASSVGNGFFFAFANNGMGSVTITPSGGDQIDGASSSIFTQTQSAFIISSGSAWYTVGKGLQNNFSVTLLNLNVAGSSDVVETSAQAENVIQQYTGTLTGNINVIVPDTVQIYYVFNNTGGPYTLTVKTASGTGILIVQGTHVILYCDGTDVVNAFTAITSVLGSPVYSVGVVGGTPNALTATAANFVLQAGTIVFLTPASFNTGPATLNVQSTGIIDIKKVSPGGFVDLSFGDYAPGIPTGVYYNGTYWVSLSVIYEGLYETISTDTTLSFLEIFNSVNITAAINLTLPSTALFPSDYYTTIFASGGAVTLIPDAADAIQGGSVGVNYVIPQGGSARLATNGAGKWTLFTYNVPFIVNDTTTNATMYPTWVTANTGNPAQKVSSTKLSFNPSTGALSSTSFVGALTGNASTATTLATGRTIAITGDLAYTSPSFDGTGNVTAAGTLATVNGNVGSFGSSTSIPSVTVNAKGLVTAASGNAVIAPAGTLTGTTLASNVVTSSLTSVSTLTGGATGSGFTLNFSLSTLSGILPIANGGTADNGSAWTPYTPSITPGTGTFTTVLATGRSKTLGKTCWVQIKITITTNGTAAGTINATLPFTVGSDTMLVGRETANTSKACTGFAGSGGGAITISFYDGTYPGANGNIIVLEGVCELT